MKHLRIGRFLLDWTNFISLGYYIGETPQWIVYAQFGVVTKKTMISEDRLDAIMLFLREGEVV